MEYTRDPRLAVLFDADNVPYSNVRGMLAEIAKYGTPNLNGFMVIGPNLQLPDGKLFYSKMELHPFSNIAIQPVKMRLIRQ